MNSKQSKCQKKFTNEQKNRYLKTSLRNHISGDFLYLDNDTLVLDNLEELNQLDYDLGAIPNKNFEEITSSQFNNYLKLTGKEIYLRNIYYNGGVFYAKDSEKAKTFFDRWHNLWLKDLMKFGFSKDQPSFALANKSGEIAKMEDKYNCQIISKYGLGKIKEAKILHYYSNWDDAIHLPLKYLTTLQDIRENGINEGIELMIKYPWYFIFKDPNRVSNEDLKFIYSPSGAIAKKIFKDFPKINKFFKYLLKLRGYNY